MRRVGWIVVALALSLLAAVPAARAEKRIALLIGNQSYASEIGELANPHNDIALLEKALKGLRFQVTSVRDAGLAMLHRSVNAYARRVRAAGPGAIAFFYYAGHGAADGGINYLIPVDVKTAEAGELWDRSLRLTEITRRLRAEAGNATHFVVFDACRNNLKLRKAGSRALVQARGFLPVREESGMLIAYATAEGQLASDGGAGAGPYASVLAEEIVKPGDEAVTMFRAVQLREAIGQEPWIGFSALDKVHLAGLPRPAAPPPPPRVSSQPSRAEVAQFCREVATNPSAAVLQALLETTKGTMMAPCVRARLDELGQSDAAEEAAEAANDRADDEARAADAERKRLALLQKQEEARKRAEAKRKVEPARRDPALSVKPGSGKSFRDCPTCPEMVVVPAGSFTMGSPASEAGRYSNEGPQRRVTFARPFAVGKYEVTRGELDSFVREGGREPFNRCWVMESSKRAEQIGRSFRDPGFAQDDRHPAVCVNWNDAEAFAVWLSRKTGKSYRLLTEAEWEYAARADTTTPYHFGNSKTELCRYGNVRDLTAKQKYKDGTIANCRDGHVNTAPVGSFRPNAFGLYDIHGNVEEWVQDCWNESYRGVPSDGSAWTTGNCDWRVPRGGSWRTGARFLRSAFRSWSDRYSREGDLGFRVARTLDP